MKKRTCYAINAGAFAGIIICILFLPVVAPNNEKIEEEEVIEIPIVNVDIPVSKPEIEMKNTEVEKTENWISLGEFKLTAYCSCEKCCGKCDGITATGTRATEGKTIGVDPKVIPYGTVVKINDHEYIAEDCGGGIKDNHIDVFFDNHSDAINFGVQYAEVFIKECSD